MRKEGSGNETAKSFLIGAGGVALSLWLGWSIVANALKQVGSMSVAAQVAPSSPLVLQRAAEEASLKGDHEQAAWLARASLSRAPLNAKAMRTLGLAEAARGDLAAADAILTQAGNWSLRDSATHLWLFERRARTGEIESALAHLDLVLRRRSDLREKIFPILQRLADEDRAAFSAVLQRLTKAPNWRASYFRYLAGTPAGQRQAVQIAIGLKQASAPLEDDEIQPLFGALITARQSGAAKQLATSLGLLAESAINDPGFEGTAKPAPFSWEISGAPGASAEALPDTDWGGRSLQVEIDGFAEVRVARQLISLSPGRWALFGRSRFSGSAAKPQWRVSCAGPGKVMSGGGTKDALSPAVEIPSEGCELQWLELWSSAGDRRLSGAAAYDNLVARRIR